MAAITDLTERVATTTTNLLLLTLATAGLYPLLWVAKHSRVIGEITGNPVADDTYVIWMAVCAGWSGALASAGGDDLAAVSGLFTLALAVLYIVWGFRAKKALEDYALTQFRIDLRLNSAYTFFFHVFYINRCIANLPEAQKRQQILSGQAGT